MRHNLEIKTIAALNSPSGRRRFGLIRSAYLRAMATWGYSPMAAWVAWVDALDQAHLEADAAA